MRAQEYLGRIKKIDTVLKNKAFEIKRLRDLGLNIGRTLDDVANLETERDGIIKTIEMLPEAEYDVLHKRYVQHETLQEIASDRKISYSLVTTIHGRALKKVEEIIHTV